jgi:hypothetical protein
MYLVEGSAEPSARPPETMILALVSSGRSNAAISGADEARQARIAAAADRLDRAEPPSAAAFLEGGAAHGDHLLGVGRLHGLRSRCRRRSAARRCRALDPMTSEICITSSRAATRGATFLPVVVAGATKASWWPISGDQRRDILGELVLVGGRRRRHGPCSTPASFAAARRRADILAGDEQVDFAELRGGGDGAVGGVLQLAVSCSDENEGLHPDHSRWCAACRSARRPSHLDAGLAPPARAVFTTVRRGVMSTP